jgi:plastocyanin
VAKTAWLWATTVLALAGCAPSAAAPTQQAPAADTPTTQVAAADCTRATKTTIAAKSGGYEFSPATVELQRGGFLAVTNKSAHVHELTSKPDAGLVTSVLDAHERQVVQFPQEGTFAIEGGGGAVLHVTVAGESGCGTPKPTLTIKDGYAFSPAKLTVAPTINFNVVNKSSAAHTLACDPETGVSKDHTRLEQGETEILAIDEPGTYTCHSVQHPSAKVVITVAGG